MGSTDKSLGRIEITQQAVATVASRAVLSSYGVVGMAPKNMVDGLANAVARDPRKGIDIHFADGHVSVDLYVVVEYGTRVTTVARSVASAVRFQIENDLGLPVGEVNVHVQGLRVSNTD
jgi:uncharacterized alkaline shock family protein YloU